MEVSAMLGLLASAFLGATLLPGASEAVLVGLLAAGEGSAAMLVGVATLGNVLGSCVNFVCGRFLLHFSDRRWFPVSPAALTRYSRFYRRYGIWTLLLSWMPIIGDPLTVLAGAARTPLTFFLVLVTAGKLARYALLAALTVEYVDSAALVAG
ncbi:YqaA family protein [Notoacmeibacter ruber]|uniref:DedA family protein n=1 Tax=Notoacmeibacter ruber TaxID=2670375 RepID=A0A3L7JEW4_9HYPH|nr:YqaA family protein [Notoacmeibacter ruber]RLQ88994.1 DedA family protein [Notoacmeibacter ruber]